MNNLGLFKYQWVVMEIINQKCDAYSKLAQDHFLCHVFVFCCLIFVFFINVGVSKIYSQTYFTQTNTSSNYLNSSLFRQEIARFEINVVRDGKAPLPITQVPRIQKNDVLKVKLLDEAVNGIKLDQSQWNWTLLVAFINPSHRMSEARDGQPITDHSGPVSEEVQFRKQGWYKEYSFTVPYDSQPVFFLYPKPQYRKQLLKVVNSKFEEIRKLGEKTIEIAGAYAQISSFLNEMQMVLNRNAQTYGYGLTSTTTNAYNPYTYNPYDPYGTSTTPTTALPAPGTPLLGLNTIPALNQVVEGLARSFNINLPSCWGNTVNNSNYGNYAGSTGYGGGYTSSYGGISGTNTTADFVNRAQCVAKNVSLQDFDISVMKMWQQGGVFLAAELQKKYPQLAYWINIAAVAIDFIVKVFQKSPLRIVPSVIQSSDNQSNGSYGGGYSSYSQYSNSPSPASTNGQPAPVKISLFAQDQPSEGQYVTAYPIVVHKWQANPDPDVISLYPPVLTEPCLHAGQNILKNTDLSAAWSEDTYSRDFKLVMSSTNGFRKEFPLKKNIGLGGWELNVTPEDMSQIPKINMMLESELTGTRGFNEIKSPKFELPLSVGGSWEIIPESQKNFAVGGKRTITLRNSLGSCRCLQSVIYKPSFGGQFVFTAGANQNSPNSLQFSADGHEAYFEVDATNFQPGAGTLEVKTYGGDQQQLNPQSSNTLNLKLYTAPPLITEVKARRGDREILITGERLDQVQAININGRRATVKGNNGAVNLNSPAAINSQSANPNQNQPAPYLNQPSTYLNQNVSQIQNSAQSSADQSQGIPTPALPNPASANAALPPLSQYQNLSANQRVAVFDDAATRITTDSLALELVLEDNRPYQLPNRFPAGLSRPSIRANELNEVEGLFLDQSLPDQNTQMPGNTPALNPADKGQRTKDQQQLNLSNYPVVPVQKSAMTVAVQNVLTDYSFRLENLSIEMRLENTAPNAGALPGIRFDVMDTNNIRLNFEFNQETNKYLSGRRLQFRIHDRERGDSDWYTIKQTFIRIPVIESIKCADAMNHQCELMGTGLDYIGQLSIDGGQSWYPQAPDVLQVKPTGAGKIMALVPELINKNLLQIKLRDYPNTEGLPVTNFVFSNTIKKTVVKPVKSTNPSQIVNQPNGNQLVNQNPNQPLPAQIRNADPNAAQPASVKNALPKGKPKTKKPN